MNFKIFNIEQRKNGYMVVIQIERKNKRNNAKENG